VYYYFTDLHLKFHLFVCSGYVTFEW